MMFYKRKEQQKEKRGNKINTAITELKSVIFVLEQPLGLPDLKINFHLFAAYPGRAWSNVDCYK